MAGQYGMYPNGGVTSLNTETGAVVLVPGPGITITPSGQDITITAAGDVPLGVGMYDSQTPSSNALTIANNLIYAQSASVSVPGMINLTTQSFAGNKTFTGTVTASNLTGTNSGDVTLGTANGLSLSGQVLSLGLASTSTTGALSSTDWNTFNNKQPAGSYVTTSEVGAANGVASLDSGGKVPIAQLPASVFIYQGTWDPNTNTPTLADGTGTTGSTYWVSAARLAAVMGLNNASMVNFQIGDLVIYNGTQYQLTTPAAGVQSVNGNTGAVTVNAINQLTGDATAGPASGSVSAALTLATVNSNVGSFTNANVTVNAKGLVTAASNGTSGVTTLAAVGISPNANAATISGSTLNLQPFSGAQPGVVTASGGGISNFLRADGSWAAPTGSAVTAPTIQQFLSGSGTYTKPVSPAPLYIVVEMVGGGGGGTGNGVGAGNSGNGTDSTFGSALLVAGGGQGTSPGNPGGAGGTASLGSGPIGLAIPGGSAQGPSLVAGIAGANGADSYFGGGGAGATGSSGGISGGNAVPNTGSGGGGGANTANGPGSAGGAGGYVRATITSPAATYAYTVGAGGSAGSPGSAGGGGGASADGIITVYEYYQ